VELIAELKALVDKYTGKPLPGGWGVYPKTWQEGKRRILEALVAREPWPSFIVDRPEGVYFAANPQPTSRNENGWCLTTYPVGWLEIIEALIEARINEKLKEIK
jgi:hypothetical protein